MISFINLSLISRVQDLVVKGVRVYHGVIGRGGGGGGDDPSAVQGDHLVGKLRRLSGGGGGGGLERTNGRTRGENSLARPRLTETAGVSAANFEILRKWMFVSYQPESSSEPPLLPPPVIFLPRGLGLRTGSCSCSCSCSCIQDQVGKLALVGYWNIRRRSGSYQGSDCHVILQQGTHQQVQNTQKNNVRTAGGSHYLYCTFGQKRRKYR